MRGNETIQVSNQLPSGKYAHVRCYDNTSFPLDRYTVVYMDRSPEQAARGLYESVGLCHCEARLGKHLGKRIPFAELPEGLRRTVLNDLS